jgi:predicted TIM-barrel fold metal-dependent hydrolase
MSEPVIDADGHIMEDHGDLFSRMTGAYGEMEWHGTWPLFDADGWQRGLARKGRREDPDAEAWLRFQDEHGITLSVVYPTAGLALGNTHLGDWAASLSQAYNDWLADRFTRVTPRIKGVALLAPHDPKQAAAELRRAVTELGFVGGCLPGVTNPNMPLFGSRAYDPLWEEAERLDTPIAVHGGVTNHLGIDRLSSFAEAHCLEHPFVQMLQLTNMIFQGVFDRFPKLRVAYLEAGVGWVPYMMDRLDEDAEKFGGRLPMPLQRAPSEYLKSGNIFFTAEVEEHTLPYVLSMLRDDVILWASDFPHERERDEFGGDLPYFRAREDISDESKRRILYDNAVRYYGLDVKA